MLYLGIDQHRKQLTVDLRGEDGEVILRRQVGTKWQAVREFLAAVRERARDQGGYLVILEVCGFNDWLLALLVEYEAREVVLLQPEERRRQKTDRRDANRLGELLWLNRERLRAGQRVQGLRRVVLPGVAEREDRQVTTLRWRLVRERTRLLNRVRALLRRHNLEQECPTKAITTQKAGKWLRELRLSELDRLELDGLLERGRVLQGQLVKVEAEVKQRQARHATAPLLATLPGLAAFGSLALACRANDIRRFDRPRSLANYWGLTPRCRNTGATTQRLGSITKQGSALARFVLAQAVLHVLRKDGQLREWYKGIRRRRGAKIARVAVMRRLATIIWHMVKHGRPYRLPAAAGVSS